MGKEKKTKHRVRIKQVVVRVRPEALAARRTAMRESNSRQTLVSVMDGVRGERPPLPALDPMEQAREAGRLAQEGNLKLCRAVEVLREAMELAIMAEVDNTTGQMVTPKQLREILTVGLDEYSRLTHQSWRRNKIIHTRAGDRDLSPESFS